MNGFVFNFESPSQIVFRQMVYRAEELPSDWLEKYLEGIQAVTPEDVLDVMRREVHPERMTILVVGNPEAFDEPLESLGPVTVLSLDELALNWRSIGSAEFVLSVRGSRPQPATPHVTSDF